ncbi:MAG TPA: hypothetical protein VM598_10715 [Bdellovibrionota bacterium]|nr:hypothetical protein [Bdellovibrionota bacterium]
MKARLSVLLLFALTACDPSAEEICQNRLPELGRSLENALTVLKDWHEDNAGRSLASTAGPTGMLPPETKLSEFDRRGWQAWAEQRLSETQVYIDRIPADPRLRGARTSLNEIANTFVSFHGYASQSRLGHMVRSLEKIRGESARIEREICTGLLTRP